MALFHNYCAKKIDRLIGIGQELTQQIKQFDILETKFYKDTEAFLKEFPFSSLADSLVLVKGARTFSFEKIVHRLQQKLHGTVLKSTWTR